MGLKLAICNPKEVDYSNLNLRTLEIYSYNPFEIDFSSQKNLQTLTLDGEFKVQSLDELRSLKKVNLTTNLDSLHQFS